MKFIEFCEVMEDISHVSGNLDKISLLADLFKKSDDKDLEHVAVFSKGEIFPTAESDKKIGMGKSLLVSSISLSSGKSESKVEEIIKEEGDVGEACLKIGVGKNYGQKTLGQNDLTVQEAYNKLEHISNLEGDGSQKEKKQILSSLLSSSYSIEVKYIIKLIMDELRVGIGEGSVREAISQAFNVDVKDVKRSIMVTANVGKVAVHAKNNELENILKIKVGNPVKAMLAQKTEIDDVLEEFNGKTAIEYKYDGFRIQIHKNGEDIKIYSRNLEDLTNSLPDVVSKVQENVQSEKAILDGEAVAYRDGEPQDFQKVLKRMKRKYNINEKMEEINIEVKLFDVLYTNEEGETIDKKLSLRRDILEEVCSERILSEYKIATSEDEIKEERSKAIEKGQEGIMAKDLQSNYTPGKRGKEWFKLKRNTETLDCIVVGGEWGEGERKGWFSSYKLAVIEKDHNQLKEVGKVGTGFSEEEFENLTSKMKSLIDEDNGMEVKFKPEVVFEIDYEEIQESPEYSSGYALRFPRFMNVRQDKNVKDADTLEKLERIKD